MNYLENSTNALDSNQPIRRQLNMIRSFAKTFRTVMNKRYSSPIMATSNENAVTTSPAKLDSELEELLAATANNTSLLGNSTVEDILSTASQMQKSIRGMDVLYHSIRDIYSVIRNGLRRYEITDSECQSRIVCEIHQKIISRNKLLKTFSLNALDLLK